jgi:hypothetical protein
MTVRIACRTEIDVSGTTLSHFPLSRLHFLVCTGTNNHYSTTTQAVSATKQRSLVAPATLPKGAPLGAPAVAVPMHMPKGRTPWCPCCRCAHAHAERAHPLVPLLPVPVLANAHA